MTNEADVFESWIIAHARAGRARDRVRRARWRMRGAIGLGIMSVVGTVAGEVLALQAASGDPAAPMALLGPYVVPIIGVIAAYASFRTAFSEHRRRTEAEMVSVRADLEKKVAHEVLDAHLHAIRTDVGGLKAGVDGIRESIQDLAVSIGELRGRGGAS